MRRAAAVAVLAVLLASAAEAKRRMMYAVNTPTGVRCSDGRIAAWGKGFAVRDAAAPEGHTQIVAFDASGGNPKTLVQSKQEIGEWCVSPLAKSVAWISGNTLHVTLVAENTDRELGEADGSLAFSPDEKTLAFLFKGQLVLRDVSGDRRRTLAPREGRRLAGPVAFSGDGKSVLVLSDRGVDKERALPDTIERADVSAEAPSLAPLHSCAGGAITDFATAPGSAQVAFIETAAGAASSVRILDIAGGNFHDFSASGSFRSVAFDTGGTALLLTGAGKTGGQAVFLQALNRSGTAQVYWRETMTVEGKGEALHPVGGRDTTWFLSPSADRKSFEVVRATLE